MCLHGGISGDSYLVADGDVPAHILRQVVTDADAVAVLLNWGIRFDGMYRTLGIGEPIIVGVHRSVHHDLVRAASFNGDIARSGGDIEADRSGDGQRAIEVTFGAGVQQRRSQQESKKNGSAVFFHVASPEC